MPLPLSINLRIAFFLAQARWQHRRRRIPLVLMLELTHACNLNCRGCGRIREYADTQGERLTREQARAIVVEAGTPVVSISGGEPLLHPDISAIVADTLALGRVVYLCTNGLLLSRRLPEFEPHPRFYFNVHMDGTAPVHDALTGLPGSAERAQEGIRQAKAAGFRVTTNTTLYQDTPVADVQALLRKLGALKVDGLMIAPAFQYEVETEARALTRAEAHRRFRALRPALERQNLYHTPMYVDFLCGEREMECVPWGTVTYTPQGWKRPCYLLTDAHVPSLRELLEETPWEHYGPRQDARCANCMLHSGFETAVMTNIHGVRDWWQLIRWQMGG